MVRNSRREAFRSGAQVPVLQTALLICAVLLWSAVHYGLMIWAMRDLLRRARVRGDNKVLWALLILIVPVLGALIYSVAAPATPLVSPPRMVVRPRRLVTHDDPAA